VVCKKRRHGKETQRKKILKENKNNYRKSRKGKEKGKRIVKKIRNNIRCH
jgi:hypothetical protein